MASVYPYKTSSTINGTTIIIIPCRCMIIISGNTIIPFIMLSIFFISASSFYLGNICFEIVDAWIQKVFFESDFGTRYVIYQTTNPKVATVFASCFTDFDRFVEV
jgi:hypothetical protein